MVDSVEIFKQADHLVEKCGTRNTEKIARELGITIYEFEKDTSLLGIYTVRWNHRMIFLNRMMEYYLRLMVIGHELGHDARHRNLAKADGMKEFTLFKMKDQTEYEANAFAAHLLLDNKEVFNLAKDGMDVVHIAQTLNSDINLVLIKVSEMNKLGYDFRIPYEPDPCFFRKVRRNGNNTDDSA